METEKKKMPNKPAQLCIHNQHYYPTYSIEIPMKGCPAYGDVTIRGTATGGRGEEEETHIYEPTGDDLRQGEPTYEVVQT